MLKRVPQVGLILAGCAVATAQSIPSYLITTVAGNGTTLSSGDGGPAILAGFTGAEGVARDLSGNLYVADFQSNRVRKVTPQGIISTVAGNGIQAFSGDGGLATLASLNEPVGVTVDNFGNLYIGDAGNNRVRRVTPQGVISTVAGNGLGSSSGDGGPAASASINSPHGVATDASGNLYVAEDAGARIRKVTPQGIISTVAGNGVQGFSGDGGSATSASLLDPIDVTVDSSGNLYIADGFGSRVRKVTAQGVISTVAGDGIAGFSGDGGLATTAELHYPNGVAIDATGNLYISEATNGRVRKVTPQGLISTVAGGGSVSGGDGGPATAVSLFLPVSVTTDSSGDIYVSAGNQIRELIPISSSTTGCVYSIDSSTQSLAFTGGAGSVSVLASASVCPWLVENFASWITVGVRGVQSGTGFIVLTIAPNTSSLPRTTQLWIAGNSFTVNQAGQPCSISATPRSVNASSGGLTGATISVAATTSDCPWTATANVSWILLSGGQPGSGSGMLTYTVGGNPGTLRTGTITVGGQTVYVNQAASGATVSSLASIAAPGVVNAASYSPPISPGGFITVFGQNLTDVSTDWNSAVTNGNLPTSLGGFQMLINGKSAVIAAVQSIQVNAIAPPDTATGQVEVDIITPHGTAVTTTTTATTLPALFTYSLRGTVYADAQFATDYAVVAASGALTGTTSRPANSGDYILLYATGLGQTNPPYPVGKVLSTAYPVPDLSQVSLTIGGQPALVTFAGLTYPGVFQINVQVPSGVPAGDLPIVLRLAGQTSQPGVYLTFGGN